MDTNQPAAGSPLSGPAQAPTAPATQPQPGAAPKTKYTLSQGIREALSALKTNLGAIVLALLISVGVSAIAFFVLAVVALGSLNRASLDTFSPSTFTGTLLVAMAIYIVLYACISAFVASMTAFAIADGADGKKGSISQYIQSSLQRIGRVITTSLLVFAVIIGPYFLLALVLFASITHRNQEIGGFNGLVILLMIAGLVWMIIAALRYGLAILVAIFEPDVPVTKTLGRSQQLLQNGGQWFLVKGVLLITLIYIVLAALTGGLATTSTSDYGSNSHSPASFVLNLFGLFIGILAQAVLVMLYRNRKAVRG